MKVRVRVKPNSKRQAVREEGGVLVVQVKSPPVEGKANEELREVLAKHFGVPKSAVRVVSGHRSRNKVVEVEGLKP